MKVVELELQNLAVDVFIRNGENRNREAKTKTNMYYPLLTYLAEQLTENQLTSLIEPHPKKDNTYYLTQYDIYSCYDSMGLDDDYNVGETHCICGVRIIHRHYIKNRETDQVHIVGSECINHWEIDPYKLQKLQNDKKKLIYKHKNNEEAIICNICNKIINKRKCGCNWRNTVAGESFDVWKKATQERLNDIGYYDIISLGKYKGLTYYELFCLSHDDDYPELLNEVSNYMSWILTTEFTNVEMEIMKEILNEFNINFLKYYSLEYSKITYDKQKVDNIIIQNKNKKMGVNEKVLCKCNNIAICKISKTEKNPGRPFYTCKDCNFFQWKNNDKSDDIGYTSDDIGYMSDDF